MGNVRRVYVEKKPDFAVKAKELKHEVKHYLGIAADQVRVLIRYDVENVSDATYQKHRKIQDLQLRFLTQEYLFRRHVSFLMPSEARMYRQHLVF